MEDGAFGGWGRDDYDWGDNLRGWKFFDRDFFIWDEGFEWGVL